MILTVFEVDKCMKVLVCQFVESCLKVGFFAVIIGLNVKEYVTFKFGRDQGHYHYYF